jgi:hypothetical protein
VFVVQPFSATIKMVNNRKRMTPSLANNDQRNRAATLRCPFKIRVTRRSGSRIC